MVSKLTATVKVLVIEAGPFDKDEDSVLVPGAYFPVPYLWLPLPTVPQRALNGRSFNVPAGRVVGGGSVVNAMVFVRPGKEELDDWVTLGAKGWDWKGLLPYYKKVKILGPRKTNLTSSRVKISLHQTRNLQRRQTSLMPNMSMDGKGPFKCLFPISFSRAVVSHPVNFSNESDIFRELVRGGRVIWPSCSW